MLTPHVGSADVATDGTMGPRVRLTAGDVTIGADLGQQRGGNLFHSFQRFGIETNGRVTFTGPDSVRNVIGRVTGAEASHIDGVLASAVPGADLYLINPAGILFGPNAQLDVKGSFHASTASELQFADQFVFSALDERGSTLSVAEPTAFGFLGASRGAIMLNGSRLSVNAGEYLSLSGATVEIRNAGKVLAGDKAVAGSEIEPAGRVTLAGVGAGTLDIATGGVTGDAGTVRLRDRTLVDASGNGGGSVVIAAEDIALEGGSSVLANNLGAIPSTGGVQLVSHGLSLDGGSTVAADVGATVVQANGREVVAVAAAGDGGSVTVEADSVRITSRSTLTSRTFGAGNAGMIDLRTADLMIDGRGADRFTGLLGTSGVDPGQGNGFGPNRPTPVTGRAGTIQVRAEDLVLRGGSTIYSPTHGTGSAGKLNIEVTGSFTIDGRGAAPRIETNVISSSLRNSPGGPGAISIVAGDLELTNNSTGPVEIRGSTTGSGDASPVTVRARQLTIDGIGNTQRFTGIISEATRGSGDAGNITVDVADRLLMRNGGQISGRTRSAGDAGAIAVTAGDLTLNGAGTMGERRTMILGTAATGSSGAGGIIDVRVRRSVDVRDGGSITTSSEPGAMGNAGDITVAAGGPITIDRAQIASTTGGAGRGGNITVSGSQLRLMANGEIGASGTASGPAGNVRIEVIRLDAQNGRIRTSGLAAEGGTIEVAAAERIYLRRAEITSSGIQPAAGSSVISLTAPQIILNDSIVTSLTGDGVVLAGSGEARLAGEVTILSADSVVAGSSAVTIDGLQSTLGSGLQLAAGSFLDIGRLLRPNCADRNAARSTFTRAGRGGLSPSPDRPLPAAGAHPVSTSSTQAQKTVACAEPCSSNSAE